MNELVAVFVRVGVVTDRVSAVLNCLDLFAQEFTGHDDATVTDDILAHPSHRAREQEFATHGVQSVHLHNSRQSDTNSLIDLVGRRIAYVKDQRAEPCRALCE